MSRPAATSFVIALALVGTLLVAVMSASSFGRTQDPPQPPARDELAGGRALEPVERFIGAPREVEQPARTEQPHTERPRPAAPPGFGVVRVRAGHSLRLYAKPWGRVIAAANDSTRFGSPTVMSVVRTRGKSWLAVTTTAMGNGRVAWVRADAPAVDRGRVKASISVDLSERTLELRRGKRVVKSVKVAIGRPGSATPTGRFAITDKLPGSRYGSYYGCCILALNGTQPNTPPGWRGGNRLAIHGTNAPGSIGTPSSAGCLRASDAALRTLMRRVPLGTPVFIHG